jgi:hypothetical protein
LIGEALVCRGYLGKQERERERESFLRNYPSRKSFISYYPIREREGGRERGREREIYQELSITVGLGRRPRTGSASPRYGLLAHTRLAEQQPTWRRLSPVSDERLAG